MVVVMTSGHSFPSSRLSNLSNNTRQGKGGRMNKCEPEVAAVLTTNPFHTFFDESLSLSTSWQLGRKGD